MQLLPDAEQRSEFHGPRLAVKPLSTSLSPLEHLQLLNDTATHRTLGTAVDVGWQTEEGGQVPLWEGSDHRVVVLWGGGREGRGEGGV